MNFPNAQSNDRPVLVTGVTGYIGGRLVPRLLETGVRVRCLARDASRLQGRPWRGDVELVVGDVLRPESLADAMRGVTPSPITSCTASERVLIFPSVT